MRGERWMVVRRSRTIPAGYRIVQASLTEDQARARAARYKRPHEAMREADLVELRTRALAKIRGVDDVPDSETDF